AFYRPIEGMRRDLRLLDERHCDGMIFQFGHWKRVLQVGERLDSNAVLADHDVCATLIDPGARIEVFDAITLNFERYVRVSAENVGGVVVRRVRKSATGNLVGETQPARVQPIQISRKGFLARVHLLNPKKQRFTDATQQEVV